SVSEGGRIELRLTANFMWTRFWFQILSASSAIALKEAEPSEKLLPPAIERCIRTVRFFVHSIGGLPALWSSNSRTKAWDVTAPRAMAAARRNILAVNMVSFLRKERGR